MNIHINMDFKLVSQSATDLEFPWFLCLMEFPKPMKAWSHQVSPVCHWNPECLARWPPGPCHTMVPTLCFHPSQTKEAPRLTPWVGGPRCSRRSLVWLGWLSGHSPTCHTASPGGKKSRWGSARSRWPSKPATWWSKHRTGTRERWHHRNTRVLDPGWRGPRYPWQSNTRVLLIPQRESTLWKDVFPARVLQPNQINIYPGFKELSKVMGLSLFSLRFNPPAWKQGWLSLSEATDNHAP